jgi:hypothetical protein
MSTTSPSERGPAKWYVRLALNGVAAAIDWTIVRPRLIARVPQLECLPVEPVLKPGMDLYKPESE